MATAIRPWLLLAPGGARGDGISHPGEDQLYNISWHPTLEEAKSAGRELEKNEIDKFFILDSEGVGYDID